MADGDGIAASTMTTYTKILKAFVRWLYENDHLDANPYRRRLKPLRVESTAKAVDERDKYLLQDQCRRMAIWPWPAASCSRSTAACATGKPRSCGRGTSGWTRARFTSRAANSKGAKPRTVYLGPELVAFLRERLPKLRQDFPLKVGDFYRR